MGTNVWFDDEVDACVEEHCCDALAPCLGSNEDFAACELCLDEGGGEQCEALFACVTEHGCIELGEGGAAGSGGAAGAGGEAAGELPTPR